MCDIMTKAKFYENFIKLACLMNYAPNAFFIRFDKNKPDL